MRFSSSKRLGLSTIDARWDVYLDDLVLNIFVVHLEVDEACIFLKEETWPEYARPATCVAIALTALVALYYHSVVTFKHCQCLDQTLFRHCHDRAMSILLNLPKLPSPDSFLACLLWQILERRKSQGDSI